MTSRNSFWASSRENYKRRIWVWIVAVLAQAVSYVGVLTLYLSRVRMWNEEGSYRKPGEFQEAMYRATQDALGFQDNLLPVLIGLAVVIGMQGFSYLYDRKKVDLYHSVPVDKNRRFFVVYLNGIVIYLAATLVNLLIGTIMAMVQHAVNNEVMAVVGLGFVWNFLAFLVLYHTVILAVMLTGNRLITLGVTGVLALYESFSYQLVNDLQHAFFQTKDDFYLSLAPKLSVVEDYLDHTWEIKDLSEVRKMAGEAFPFYGKWVALAAVLLAAAWLAYRRRPSEAAGKAMAFRSLNSFLKVFVVIPAAVGLGMWVYNAGYGNATLMLVTVVASGLILCAVMEVIYDFDLRSMFRHLLSSGIAVAGVVVVFFIFKKDLFGYDKYIPEADQVESIALVMDYYPDFWDEDFSYIAAAEASEAYMHIEDTEPVLALAKKAQETDQEDMDDSRMMRVLYRLSSGRKVGRTFLMDFSDPETAELLDQITQMRTYKEGTFQIVSDEESFDQAQKITWINGAVEVALPIEDGRKIREAYLKDMERFSFTLARNNRPVGEIRFRLPNWMIYTIEIYENFENTIAYLQSKEAFYPARLDPEDIESITVTNYHYELQETQEENSEDIVVTYEATRDYPVLEDSTVTETFYEQDQIARIVEAIYPSVLSTPWSDYREMDNNYSVSVIFKKDTDYPFIRSDYSFNYQFFTDKVPEFVIEATALGAQDAEGESGRLKK